MSLDDIVNITFSLTEPGVTRAGFGIPLILSNNAAWAERTRTYGSITDVAADFGAATPEYLAASKMFSQSTGLTTLMIGRGANDPTQRFSIGAFASVANAVYKVKISTDNGSAVYATQECDYTAVATPAWAINTVYAQGAVVVNDSAPLKFYVCTTGGTSAGSGGPTGTNASIADNTVTWMYAGTGVLGTASNDAIVYGLQQLINALVAPALAVTTSLQGSAGAKTLRILANTAAAFFGVEVLDMTLLSIAQDHADPGIAADLDAIKAESNAWYGLVTLYNSSACIMAAAAWVEANQKLYTPATQDSLVATQALGVGSDVAQSLKLAAYARTGFIFHTDNGEFADGVEMARWFPIDPGSDNWRLKSLAGVTAKTYMSTMTTNIVAKLGNYYAILGGNPLVQGNGNTAANQFIDIIRFRDWYATNLQEDLVDLLVQNEKVPFDEDGIVKVENVIRARNTAGVNAGGIAPNTDATPIIIVMPALSSIAASDKSARWLKNVKTSWFYAGAIDKISATVTPTA